MNFYTLFALFLLCGMKVHSIRFLNEGTPNVGKVRGSKHVPLQDWNIEDRALQYDLDDIFGPYDYEYDCGPLEQKCSSLLVYECCELSSGGVAVFVLIALASVVAIVACSCACCKCCPWYDRMCCAARARRAVLAEAPASGSTNAEAPAKDAAEAQTVNGSFKMEQ
jgi:hypothetical protein